jgi:hypothetical protein
MPTATKTEPLSLSELTNTPEFNRLTVRQGIWVLVYLAHYLDTEICDAVAATQAAYECASEESARVLSYQIQASPNIRATLNRFFGDDSPEIAARQNLDREAQIAGLKRALKKTPPYEQPRGRRLLAELTGLINTSEVSEPKTATVPAQKFSVGDFVMQNNQKYRVTSVDANGHPLTAEPTP